jgi:APA family basic amino acid/polyamine antiporter
MIFGSFVDTILYTAAAVYAFYLGTSLSVIVLRIKEPHIERPYRVTGYPVTTLIFCALCAFLIYSCVSYALATRRASIVVLLSVLVAGMIVYWLTDIRSSKRRSRT